MSEEQYVRAQSYLDTCIKAYQECGVSGWFVLGMLTDMKNRLARGERSIELYNDIMEVEL